MITPGVYRHFRGGLYEVIGVGLHTELKEEMVIYRPMYKSEHAFFVRPVLMFQDTVEHQGEVVPRFELLREIIHHHLNDEALLP